MERNPFFSLRRGPRFFGKDENGKIIFYPWECPGEAFYVNTAQRKKIIVFLGVTFVLAVLSFIALCPPYSFNDPKGIGVNIFGYVLFSMILPALYYYFMNQFTKGLEPYVVSKKKMPFVLNWLFLLLFIHLMGISAGLYIFSFSSILITILIVISGICSVLLILFPVSTSWTDRGSLLR
jgi:hypothetical protein